MKQLVLLFAATLLLGACEKNDPADTGKTNDAGKVTEINVPAHFDWKTTASVACNFSAPHPSKIFVSTEKGGDAFASFIVGGDADPVALSVPAATRSLFVSYETEDGGVSAQETVPVSGGAATFGLTSAAKSKDYTGIDDGDKNSTEGSVIYMPARKNGWGTLLFEDLWPAYGDYDFNDMVVNYKVQLYMNNKNKVDAMLIGVRVKAVGGSLPYDLYLSLQGVRGGEIDQIEPYHSENAHKDAALVALNSANNVKNAAVLKFENIRPNANKPAGAIYLNTEEGYEMADDDLVYVSYLVSFRNSIAYTALSFDTFDFYLGRTRESDGRRMEIHMGGFKPSIDALSDYNAIQQGNSNIDNAARPYYSNDNLVWAINIPSDIRHGYERVDFMQAYPQFKDWAQSGGTQAHDWYEKGVRSKLVTKR